MKGWGKVHPAQNHHDSPLPSPLLPLKGHKGNTKNGGSVFVPDTVPNAHLYILSIFPPFFGSD